LKIALHETTVIIDAGRIIEYHHLRSEYRFSQETDMAGMGKAYLFSRLRELHIHQGKTWKEIEDVLRGEGYQGKGKFLTANALRKRFTRWSKTDIPSKTPAEPEVEPAGFRIQSEESQRDRHGRQLDEVEFGLPGSKIASSLASLVSLNNHLLEQLREFNVRIGRLERDIEEQKSQTSHTGIDTGEQPVTTRDLLELLKEFSTGRQKMQFIEEERKDSPSREELQHLIDESIQDRVDAELKAMLDGEPVKTLISQVLDERLKAYMGGITVKEQHSGPGRGRSGKTHKKFSASLPEDLFEEVKSLPGMFSAHLDAALRLYLKMTKGDEQ